MLGEALRSPLVRKALDAAMTASLRPRRRLAAHLRTLLSLRSSNYDRVAAAVNTIDSLIPGSAHRTTALICRPMDLPFAAERVELLAFGSGATVFRAAHNGSARVVKVYRRSLGVPRARLPAVLEGYRDQYGQMCRLYGEAAGVVWPAEFMIIGGPILHRPAVACVQEFIGVPMRDFFDDLTAQQALQAFAESPDLCRQFLAFAAPTLELYRAQARCPDFLGRHNLTVAGLGDRARLRLIDYRITPAAPQGGRNGALRQRQDRCMQRIAALLEALT